MPLLYRLSYNKYKQEPNIQQIIEHVDRHGVLIIDLMIKAKFCNSKSEARRIILNNGIKFNDMKIVDPEARYARLEGENFILVQQNDKLSDNQ